MDFKNRVKNKIKIQEELVSKVKHPLTNILLKAKRLENISKKKGPHKLASSNKEDYLTREEITKLTKNGLAIYNLSHFELTNKGNRIYNDYIKNNQLKEDIILERQPGVSKLKQDAGYQSLATYASRQTGKNITAKTVKKWLKKHESTIKAIEEKTKKMKNLYNPDGYKWGAIQRMLVNSFK